MRFLLSLLLSFSSVCCLAQFRSPDLDDLGRSEVELALKEHVGYLSSAMLEGRAAGSEGELMAAQYVSSVLESYGIDVLSGSDGEMFGLRGNGGDTLRSRNVIAYIPGYDEDLRDRFIVIGARLDNLGSAQFEHDGVPHERIFYGANGNASGLAMLLELARKLSINGILLKRSVIIAAFGSSGMSNAGAWYFLNRSFSGVDDIDAMINLDMLGIGSGGFYAYTCSNPDLNDLVNRLSGTLQPVLPQLVSMEPVSSDHRAFYEKEIPSIFFTTGMYPEYNSDRDTASILEYDEMERELDYIFNFAVELAAGPRPEFRRSDAPSGKLSDDGEAFAFGDCDVKPRFLGSSDPSAFLSRWVYVYLRYPEQAVRNGIQGRVLVNMVIDERGKVTDVKVVKGVDPLLDAEAVRVVSASPDWKPAIVRGEKVKCELSLYVDFKLERRK